MSPDFLTGALNRSMAYATPILWTALGEICAESAGVVNLALDGMLVVSALAAFVTVQTTHSLGLGVLAGMAAAALVALPQAFASITLRVNQFVTGLALAMLCPGIASLLGRKWVGIGIEQPFQALSIPLLDQIPILGPALFTDQCLLSYLAGCAAIVISFFFYFTRWGIIWRAAGESPIATEASGISVLRLRYVAVIGGGLFVGVGGSYLSLYYEPAWVEGITGGMGWVGLAIVIFAGWRPLPAVAGALFFGFLYHLSFRLQEQVNPHILKAMPYLFVVLVLIIGSWGRRRSRMPQSVGLPYFREDR
jgi:simple sugar transport system permease protein